MHSNSVVLPDPFGPIRPRTSPSWIDSDTSATAVRRPYDFVSPSIETRGACILIWKVYRGGLPTTSHRRGRNRESGIGDRGSENEKPDYGRSWTANSMNW